MAGPSLFRPGNIPTGLQGNWKLGEASGSRSDSSPNGNTLTDNNTVLATAEDYWRTGENSADFESGNSEYLSIADGSQVGLGITSNFSFCAWIKPESLAATGYLFSKGGAFANGYAISIDGNINVYINANLTQATPSTIIPVGKWSHIAVVFDDTNNFVAIYLDGNLVKVGAEATSPTSNSDAVNIGRNSNLPGQYFDGLMKDAAIWNVALTPLQIKSLALGVEL